MLSPSCRPPGGVHCLFFSDAADVIQAVSVSRDLCVILWSMLWY